MLYLIKDTSVLHNGPAAPVNLTAHPGGEAPEWLVGMTSREHSNAYNV